MSTMGKGMKRKRPGGPRRRRKSGTLEYPIDSESFFEVEKIFQKTYTYPPISDEEIVLPNFDEEIDLTLDDEELQDYKNELNTVKSELSHIDINEWHRHTGDTHPGGLVMTHMRQDMGAELCTQAWCKFREVLGTFGLPDVASDGLSSVHLCEGPGGFICSLNHYLHNIGRDSPWKWLGQTLNPYYEGNSLSDMIDDDQFIYHTLDRWHFGTDNSGDVTLSETVKELLEATKDTPVHLVTADGSLDCANAPAEQESMTHRLHFCELVTALHLLTPGGQLVLKMFTMFERCTVELMFLLCSAFKQVNVFKPVTSKPGNSELYVIAKDYRSLPAEVLARLKDLMDNKHQFSLYSSEAIPESFLAAHRECSRLFTESQMDIIEENIDLFESGNMSYVKKIRRGCLHEYIRRYGLQPLDREDRILPHTVNKSKAPIKKIKANNPKPYVGFRHDGTYENRQREMTLLWERQVDRMELLPENTCALPWLTHEEEKELDFSVLQPVMGKAFDRVLCSRFCGKHLLYQYNALLDKAKCSIDKQEAAHVAFLEDVAPLIVGKLREGLGSSGMVLSDRVSNDLSASVGKALADTKNEEEGSIASDGSGPKEQTNVLCMSLYSDLSEVCWLKAPSMMKVLQGLELLSDGDALVIESPPFLTRINAGVLFCIHILFSKVTVVVPEDVAFPMCFVVAIGYKAPLPEVLKHFGCLATKVLGTDKPSDGVSVENSSSELELRTVTHNVLSFVPFQYLYETDLNNLLWCANEALVTNRLNHLIKAEKQYYEEIRSEPICISE